MKTHGEVVAELIEELIREVIDDVRDDHNVYNVPEIRVRLAAALNGEVS